MPEKNEEPDSTPDRPLGGHLSDRPMGGHPSDRPMGGHLSARPMDGPSASSEPVTLPLLSAIGNRCPETPTNQRSPGRLGQILVSFWRSLACHSQGPVQHPRGPLLIGLRFSTSYFQVSKKEVA